ncbi:sensor domain-containing diguanylate cyclase [Clostridium gasigenes]|uniref:Sensor domain-containing diguanylate cyclase n=1 Tax=Clostridium gasigenes TaxID=94869 RepID=A0A7X0S9N6_9CLOT|nr:sensor domain-containing diguanylate cyclase [Clostridium gasigenes]MBB6713554.1 sensor domain-containing diguanylate cyclase [Clostridium gasigenes]
MGEEDLNYKDIKMEFQRYQQVTEGKIQQLSESNMKLEKSLNALSNIVEVSNYVNSFLSNENLIPMINDMIIGILGVTHCTIYILEDNELVVKATNGGKGTAWLTGQCKKYMKEHQTFTINSNQAIMICKQIVKSGIEIHSRMGVPIKIRDKFIGYIILDHTHNNFFNGDHEIFVNAISNQIAIAIENSILYREIKNAAKVDPLIGIYNRKTFFEIIENKIKEEKEASKKYAIIMIDLDDFKTVNDTLGHQFGDTVLINTTTLIRGKLSYGDIIARYGGEEIIIYIDDAEDEDKVFSRVERIRKAVEFSVVEREGITKHITASFGLSFYPQDGNNLLEIINSADKLLYKAKYAGKNKVISSHLKR